MTLYKLMNINICLSKTDCTNKFSIPKLCENSPFHNSTVNHATSRNNYIVTFTFYEKSRKPTEQH